MMKIYLVNKLTELPMALQMMYRMQKFLLELDSTQM